MSFGSFHVSFPGWCYPTEDYNEYIDKHYHNDNDDDDEKNS